MKKLLLLPIALIILAIGAFFIMNKPTPTIKNSSYDFIVEKGTSAGAIATHLQNQQLIHNALFFKIYSKFSGYASQYKAGSYLIPANLSTIDIAKLLYEGKTKLFKVTIPEGRSLKEVATILAENGFVASAEDFITAASSAELLTTYHILGPNAQGFLFPDTYSFPKPYNASLIAKKMIDTFYIELATIEPDYQELSDEELNRKITMAGLVEKEYRVAEEAPIMASVFYNRLDIDMRLESCASVIYVLTQELNQPHPQRLLYSDLEVESPYNVYKNYGLPPSAISNPGTVAIEAAFHPASTDYLFFVVKDLAKGSHQFSATLAEHNQGYLNYVNNYFAKQ